MSVTLRKSRRLVLAIVPLAMIPLAMKRTLLLLAAGSLLAAGDAFAQQQSEPRAGSDVDLPSWVAPNAASSRPPAQPPSPEHAPFGASSSAQQRAPAQTHTPGPPDPENDGSPEQTPLGGLEWLALAGGAYAARRLYRHDDEAGDDAPA